ncbi:Sarcolemmal membrane-associated protein [Trichoplax sp. H2]|nr:Sarcolemmal membrane-associated protein [Trichoplax sp. H2]|eukprot:RDD41360.1 Sarcolemmal membrane-associated protein [Trichoplax sp. H2]
MAADVNILVSFKYCGHSHLFNDRLIDVNKPVKIGRSTYRVKPTDNNLIFTCKVLSRNHAILWYEDNKLWLKDTNSSNGTFVNNARIVTDVEAKELHNGDLLQFGIDVVDADKNVNHNCIIGSLEWPIETDIPRERMPTPDKILDVVTPPVRIVQHDKIEISKKELVQLSKYMKEAVQREKSLKMKLTSVVEALVAVQQCQKINLQGSIKEDYLLARIDTLESELEIFSKNGNKDTFSEQLIDSQEAKYRCELQLKDSLQNNLMEKLNANKVFAEMQIRYDDVLQELTLVKVQYEEAESKIQSFMSTNANLEDANKNLGNELKTVKNDNDELIGKVDGLNTKCEEMDQMLKVAKAKINEREELLANYRIKLNFTDAISNIASTDIRNVSTNAMEIITRLIEKLQEMDLDVFNYLKSIVDSIPDTAINHVEAQAVIDNKDLTEEKNRLQEQINRLLSEEEASKIFVNELQSKYQSVTAELFSKEKEIDLLKTAHDSKLRTLQDELDANKDEHTKTMETIKTLQKSLEERTLFESQLQEENKNLRNRLDQASSKIE